MTRKNKRNDHQDNRKQKYIGNKWVNDKQMNIKREKQDQHQERQNNAYHKRLMTKVMLLPQNGEVFNRYQPLSSLFNFNTKVQVEDFEEFDQSRSKQVCFIDKIQLNKFKTTREFDQFMTPAKIQWVAEVFDSLQREFKKEEQEEALNGVFHILNQQIPGGFKLEEDHIGLQDYKRHIKQDQPFQNVRQSHQRVYKQKGQHHIKNETQPRKQIENKTKILIQQLQLNSYPQKKIAELTGVNVNSIKTVICRMRKGVYTRCWDRFRIDRKLITPEQTNTLFKFLDDQKGDDTSWKVTKHYLKSRFSIEAKKQFVQSLLRQGNFTTKKGVNTSKGEQDDGYKQRKQLYNLYFFAVIAGKAAPWFFQDEFGLMLNTNNQLVIVRRGLIKGKHFKKYDKKLNVSLCMNQDGLFNYQISKEGYTSISSMQQLKETITQIAKEQRSSKVVYLSCDGASMHCFNPALSWIDRWNDKSNVKVIPIFSSALNSKVNVIERAIHIVKQAIRPHYIKSLEEAEQFLDFELKKISKLQIHGVWRRSVTDWKQYLDTLNENLQQSNNNN